MSVKNKKVGLSLLLAFMYFASYFTRKDFAVSIAAIVEEGILTKPEAGTVGTALFITYGAGQLLSGWLSDKYPPNRVAAVGFLITSFCNLLFPFAGDLVVMTVLWAINGLAQAFMWPPIVRMLSMYLEDKEFDRGYLLVCYGCYLGNILLYLVVPLCLQTGSWKTIFYLATAMGFLCLSLILLFYPALTGDLPRVEAKNEREKKKTAEKPEKEPGTAENGGLGRLLWSSGTILLVVAVALEGFLKDGIETWLPTLISEIFSLSADSSILSGTLLPILSIVMATVATNLHRSVMPNEAKGNAVFFAICIPLLGILFVTFGATSAFVTMICVALCSGCMHGASIYASLIPLRFKDCGKVGTVTGFVNACSYVGSAVSSFGVALIADKMGWRNTFLSWILVAVMGLTFCLIALTKYAGFVGKKS